jgi:hypothetical protein
MCICHLRTSRPHVVVLSRESSLGLIDQHYSPGRLPCETIRSAMHFDYTQENAKLTCGLIQEEMDTVKTEQRSR